MAEQRTLNPQVLGSNPRGRTTLTSTFAARSGPLVTVWSQKSVERSSQQRGGLSPTPTAVCTSRPERRARQHELGQRSDQLAGARLNFSIVLQPALTDLTTSIDKARTRLDRLADHARRERLHQRQGALSPVKVPNRPALGLATNRWSETGR